MQRRGQTYLRRRRVMLLACRGQTCVHLGFRCRRCRCCRRRLAGIALLSSPQARRRIAQRHAGDPQDDRCSKHASLLWPGTGTGTGLFRVCSSGPSRLLAWHVCRPPATNSNFAVSGPGAGPWRAKREGSAVALARCLGCALVWHGWAGMGRVSTIAGM